MKNTLVAVALVCSSTLGIAACAGEDRNAVDPSSQATSVVTTETTTTSANPGPGARSAAPARTPAVANVGTDGARRDAANTSPSTNTGGAAAPVEGWDPARAAGSAPHHVSNPGAATNPTVVANPGVANGSKDADNTKVNDRDRHGAVTPMDQGGGNDRDITAAIRRSVVADGSLSFTAKNVKIITAGGKVTLRGPVKSDAEKSAIEAKAKSAAGVSEVDNQLEVKK